MEIFSMRVRLESATGVRTWPDMRCQGADEVDERRAHFRSLAPVGSTMTITVRAYER